MRRIKVEIERVEGRSYPVLVGAGVLDLLGRELIKVARPGRALLVTDETVAPLYAPRCTASLREAGFKCRVERIPPGESSKCMDTALRLYDAAVEEGLDRQAPVISLGGGVVGDLAGFVASTYLRGVPFIQVPTTLLSQVDSSVGGKVGINHPLGKNLIGAFYQPALVAADLDTLQSLSRREFKAGLAEVIKYGVMADGELFQWLEENLELLLSRKDISLLERVIGRCVEIKAGVVKEDEREAGGRRVLNLGHTFGHALEAATAYGHYLHGEAVLSGMEMAASLALKLGLLDKEEKQRMSALFGKVGFTEPPAGLRAEEIRSRLRYDKKRRGESTVLVLPLRVGRVAIHSDPPAELLEEAIQEHLGIFTTRGH